MYLKVTIINLQVHFLRILDSVHFAGINFCYSGGNTVVPFKRGVACTLESYLQSSRLMIFMRAYSHYSFFTSIKFAFLCKSAKISNVSTRKKINSHLKVIYGWF